MSVFHLSAQSSYPKETVHVKDGNKFTGYIIELVPDESIKIQLSTENIITIKWDEILKIERDFSNAQSNSFSSNSGDMNYGVAEEGDRSRLKKGYKNILEATVVGGEIFGVSITDVSAIQFNPYLSLGLGVGVENMDGDGFAIPAFVDFRYYWFDAKVSPYVATKSGIHFNLESSYRSEYLFNSILGLKIDLEKSTLLLGVGYRPYDTYFSGTFNVGFIFN